MNDALVTEELIRDVRRHCTRKPPHQQLRELDDLEPELVYLVNEMSKMAINGLEAHGVPDELVRHVDETFEWSAVVLIEVLRRAHYEIWEDTMVGTRLKQLDPQLPKRVKQRRKRNS